VATPSLLSATTFINGGESFLYRHNPLIFRGSPSLTAQHPHYRRDTLITGGDTLIIGANPSLSPQRPH
jgi:hypothetical protein